MERVDRIVVKPGETASVGELFERARQAANRGEWEKAAGLYEQVVSLDLEGRYEPEAKYRAGVALDNASSAREARVRALELFLEVKASDPQGEWGGYAQIRALRLAVHLEEWGLAAELALPLLEVDAEVPPSVRVLAHAASAVAAIRGLELDRAEALVEAGRSIIEDHRLDEAGKLSRDLAALYFASGELKGAKADAIRFDALPAAFAERLELRCQLLLDAQRDYSHAMRAYDAHWSAMAGVRTAELYASLHRDLVTMPSPPKVDSAQRRDLFEGALRLRYAVLLDKAQRAVEQTLEMLQRTGEPSAWSERARQARERVLEARHYEEELIGRLPYSREELEAALAELKRRSAASGAAP